MEFVQSIIFSFITIFLIMDPFASLPPFLALTKKCKNDCDVKSTANKAVAIAGVLALIFVFGGVNILNMLSITLFDFKVAGGIVLILMGLENVLGFRLSKDSDDGDGLYSAAVLIATPLLTGPGLISSLILLVQENSITPVLIALAGALLLCLVILRNAVGLRKMLGHKTIIIMSKIIGLFLIALGVAYMKNGLVGV